MAPPRLGQTRMSQRRFLRRGGDDSESSVEEPPSLADPPGLSRLLPCMETIGGLTRSSILPVTVLVHPFSPGRTG
eukprot:764609-Hanusia_phi.AAC.2